MPNFTFATVNPCGATVSWSQSPILWHDRLTDAALTTVGMTDRLSVVLLYEASGADSILRTQITASGHLLVHEVVCSSGGQCPDTAPLLDRIQSRTTKKT